MKLAQSRTFNLKTLRFTNFAEVIKFSQNWRYNTPPLCPALHFSIKVRHQLTAPSYTPRSFVEICESSWKIFEKEKLGSFINYWIQKKKQKGETFFL